MANPPGLKKKRSLSTYLSYVGNFALAAMMLLTTADVIGRYFFNAPVLGAYEITEYLMLIMVFFIPGFGPVGKGPHQRGYRFQPPACRTSTFSGAR